LFDAAYYGNLWKLRLNFQRFPDVRIIKKFDNIPELKEKLIEAFGAKAN
jgi:hypothetical protein